MEQQQIRAQVFTQQSPSPTVKFEHWCLVELFGHQQIAGLVTEATIGGCAFLRVDVPTQDGMGWLYTRYFGNGAIYAINPTAKEDVLKIVGIAHPAEPTPRHVEPKRIPSRSASFEDWDEED